MGMSGRSVLVIEDEHHIAQLLKLHLVEHCDEVAIVTSGHEGLRAAKKHDWGLIILDLSLPGMDGLEICRRLRAMERYTPILMLTARGSEHERVRGLRMGADDYVAKPFSLQELLARVHAIFRRCAVLQNGHPTEPNGIERYKNLCIDLDKRSVNLKGEQIALTAREFDLLVHFVRHPERVYTRAQLLDQVWGHGHQGYEHTVNSHINRLRAKIEKDPSSPEYITTVWGVGYRLG